MDHEDLKRLYDELIEYLSDHEDEEFVCIVAFVRDEAVRPYGDSDDIAASITFSNLSSIN